MIASSLIGLLSGLLLGSRCKVFSIILAHAIAILATIALGVWGNSSLLDCLLALMCWSVTLQIGYVAMVSAGAKAGRTLYTAPSRA